MAEARASADATPDTQRQVRDDHYSCSTMFENKVVGAEAPDDGCPLGVPLPLRFASVTMYSKPVPGRGPWMDHGANLVAPAWVYEFDCRVSDDPPAIEALYTLEVTLLL